MIFHRITPNSNRQIRVFISSTFRDMHQERDHLINHIFPKIKIYCQQRNIIFTEVDLRWGITEDQAENGEVIKLCLDEIDRSHPFFIGLIGDRYGYIPTREDIEKDLSFLEQHSWLNDSIKHKHSITEIEIQYGVLRSKDPVYGHFYLRESSENYLETSENPQLKNLKNIIRNQNKIPYSSYSNIESLGEMVYNSLISTINKLYPNPIVSVYEQQAIHQNCLRTRCLEHYICLDNLLEKLEDFAHNPSSQQLLILGENGSGKTSLICDWECKSSIPVITYYIGTSSTIESPSHILKYLIHSISRHFGIQYYDIYRPFIEVDEQYILTKDLADICQKTVKPWILVIDGIDLLPDENQSMNWIPTLPNHIKTVYSARTNSFACKYTHLHNGITWEIPPLDSNKRYKIAIKYFASYGKTLPTNLLSQLATSCTANSPYTYLTILNEIRKYGSHETLNQCITNYCSKKGRKQLYASIIMQLASYDNDQDEIAFRSVCTYLYISHLGLTEKEIMELCSITPMTWANIYSRLYFHLNSANGLILFKDAIFKEVIGELFAKDNSHTLKFRETIITYFINLRKTQLHEPRREWEELSWQLLRTENYEQLNTLAKNLDAFDAWFDKDQNSYSECSLYWDALEAHGYPISKIYDKNIELIPIKQLFSLNKVCCFCYWTNRISDFNSLCNHLGILYKNYINEDIDAGTIGFVQLLQIKYRHEFRNNEYNKSEQSMLEAIDLLTSHYNNVKSSYNQAIYTSLLVGSYNNLGNCYAMRGQYKQAETCYKNALNFSTVNDINYIIKHNIFITKSNLAFLHFMQKGDNQSWNEIVDLYNLAKSQSDLYTIASITLKMGKMSLDDNVAIHYLQQSVDIYNSMPYEKNKLITVFIQLAERYFRIKDFKQTEKYYERAIDILRLEGTNNSQYYKTLLDIIHFYMTTQQIHKVEKYAERIIDEIEKLYMPTIDEYWILATTFRAFAYAKLQLSDTKESLSLFKRGLKVFTLLQNQLTQINPTISVYIEDIKRQINRISSHINS